MPSLRALQGMTTRRGGDVPLLRARVASPAGRMAPRARGPGGWPCPGCCEPSGLMTTGRTLAEPHPSRLLRALLG